MRILSHYFVKFTIDIVHMSKKKGKKNTISSIRPLNGMDRRIKVNTGHRTGHLVYWILGYKNDKRRACIRWRNY